MISVLSHSGFDLNAKMKGGFSLIDDYQSLVQNMDETDDESMAGLDQEVPVSPFCDIKPPMPLDLANRSFFNCNDDSNISRHKTPNAIKPEFDIAKNNKIVNSFINNIPTIVNEETHNNIAATHGNLSSLDLRASRTSPVPTSKNFSPYNNHNNNINNNNNNNQSMYSRTAPQHQTITASPSHSWSSSSSFSSSSSSSPAAVSLSHSTLSSSTDSYAFQKHQITSNSLPSKPTDVVVSSSGFLLKSPSCSPSPMPMSAIPTIAAIPLSFSFSNSSPSSSSLSVPSSLSSLSSTAPFTSSSTLSSPFSTSVASTTPVSYIEKRQSFVSESGQNGCTVLSSMPNFLLPTFNNNTTTTTAATTTNNSDNSNNFIDDGSFLPEYTDLDKVSQPTFYDELMSARPKDSLFLSMDAKHSSGVPHLLADESPNLEMMVGCVRDALEQDSMKLNLALNPLSWTPSDVSKWTKWVCFKNNVSDVSDYIRGCNGTTLCSWDSDTLTSQFPQIGPVMYQELELWKTASSYDMSPSYNHQSSMPFQQSLPSHVCLTPSVSPCPSHGSLESSMDNSVDDVFCNFADKNEDRKPSREDLAVFKRGLIKPQSGRGHKKAITLWQFLLELLVGKTDHSDCIRWLDREARIFKIEDSKKVATLWGSIKNRPAMNYDKLSRSVRQYYKKGIIQKPTVTKRLVYQFCKGIC